MRYVLALLMIPFLLAGTEHCVYKAIQDPNRTFETSWEPVVPYDLDSYEIEEINDIAKDFDAVLYKDNLHINIDYDGHLWTPILFVHSSYCPLCRTMPPPGSQKR